MAIVSHSVANPTFGSNKKLVKLEPEKELDIYGKPSYDKLAVRSANYKSITSSSKGIPDFKEQDFIRTKTLVQKRAYYSASKMTYAQAGIKADEVRSYGVTQSVAYDNDSLFKTLAKTTGKGTTTWATMTGQTAATSVQSGDLHLLASDDGTNWDLQRGVLWFDLDGLPNHVSYSAAYLDLYTVAAGNTITDGNNGLSVRLYRWTGLPNVSIYDFNDFDNSAASLTYQLTCSAQAELNSIPINSTLLDWMNDYPSGSFAPGHAGAGKVGFMIRPQLDVAQALLPDPSGVNEIIFYDYNHSVTPTYRPTLRLEYSTTTVPGFKNDDGTQRVTDHDGTALDVNDVVKIEGALSNIPNSNHNIVGKYSQNFLGQANRGASSNWQVAVSSSGVDEANSELTLVNQTNGWNFKIKKKSLGNLTGSLLNFNKIAD